MTAAATTPGGINPNPRTNAQQVQNWQRLAQFLASGALSIDASGALSVNVIAPLAIASSTISLSLDEVSGLMVMGDALAANTHAYTSGEVISGDRIVYADASGDVFAADSGTTAAGSVVGMSRNAAAMGATVNVITAGRITGLAGLTPGAVYFVGSAGAITPTPPASGLLQRVGVALTTSVLVLQLGEPVARA